MEFGNFGMKYVREKFCLHARTKFYRPGIQILLRSSVQELLVRRTTFTKTTIEVINDYRADFDQRFGRTTFGK